MTHGAAAVDCEWQTRPGKHCPVGNVVLVHDYLTQRGGAERVVLEMAAAFPGAPLLTSLYDRAGTFPEFAGLEVRTSRLDGIVPPQRFRLGAPLYRRAFEHLDLGGAERAVVSSSGFAHHVRHPRALVYCHTPPRFLYDAATYLGRPVLAGVLRAASVRARRLDRAAARRHTYIANSAPTQERIAQAYGIEAEVLHPPLRTEHLPAGLTPPPQDARALVVSRLLPYKRVDLAIAACERAGVPLTVVGDGPDLARLQALAGPGVRFLGRVPDDRIGALHQAHSVLLVPGVEDFGLAAVEAAYCGRPVVARAAGGSLETVLDGTNGILVDGDAASAWAEGLLGVVESSWDQQLLRKTAERFAADHFRHRLRTLVDAL